TELHHESGLTNLRDLHVLTPRPPSPTLFPLHDALPIYQLGGATEPDQSLQRPRRTGVRSEPDACEGAGERCTLTGDAQVARVAEDRKSTRLNSSHVKISYAVFCLKKKNDKNCKNEDEQQ